MPETVGLLIVGEEIGSIGLLSLIGIGGAAGAAVTVAGAVGAVVLIGGAIGLQLLLNKPRQTASPSQEGPALPEPEAGHQPIKQAIAPRIVGYGRARLAGAYVLFEAQNGISYDVLAVHHGKISAFVGYYLHDDVVTINPTTGIVDIQGDGRYGSSAVTIKTRLGNVPEIPYVEITSALPLFWGPASPDASPYRGDGLASLMMICNKLATPTDFANTFPRGKPEPSVVADCTPIFDPRDATQSLGSPTTWKVSSNPVLQIIDFLTNSDRGMGFDYATMITPSLTVLMAEANLCDQLVAKKDGSVEARYASNGTFPLDSDPSDVIASILDTGDIWISENGDGSLVLKVGQYAPPTLVLKSEHILSAKLQYDVADEEAVNELTIDYTEPTLDYKTTPGQSWRDEQDISDRGRVRSQRFPLPWVYSHAQARRLSKRRMAQFSANLRGTITTKLYGLQAISQRWIQVLAPDFPSLSNVVIENRGTTVDLLNATVTIKFVSVNPNSVDAWDPATEEGSMPTIPSKLVSLPPPVPQNIFGGPASGPNGSHFRVSCDPLGRSDLALQSEWRVNGSSDAFTVDGSGEVPFDFNGHPSIHGGYGATSGVTYEVKMRSIAPGGAQSAFSSSTTIQAA